MNTRGPPNCGAPGASAKTREPAPLPTENKRQPDAEPRKSPPQKGEKDAETTAANSDAQRRATRREDTSQRH
jgi:hypothetical protein